MFKIGDKVIYGRGHGEQTHGTVVKVNAKRVKVRQDEPRGVHPVGTEWSVPFVYVRLADGSPAETPSAAPAAAPVEEPVKASLWMDAADRNIMEAINCVYAQLSPENLTCDGELPRYQVNQRHSQLQRKLRGLFAALGRTVSESAAYDWQREMERLEKEHKERKADWQREMESKAV